MSALRQALASPGAAIDVIAIPLDGPPCPDALSPDERLRAARFIRPRDGARYAAAHNALRQLLAAALGADPAALDFAAESAGKPWLPAYPELGFNLSHSGDAALVALARGARLGVDLEQAQRDGRELDWQGIAESYFSAGERLALGDADDGARRFLRMWTAKEAVLKAMGSGLSGLADVEIALDAAGRPRLVSAHGDSWRLHALETEDGHAAALVHDGAPRPLRLWRAQDFTLSFPT
ncbi:4'-phosphopantetheinyl transferase family protein [Chromobacterium subtsugae]|uniref:4'-phosphopantetheinyl transferase family protein n=1 Tax=Chromobacterium subtsugae TaxID=251747 RepID=UPI000ABB13A4|nr:4'-phosphopantetheinyl transferase superfamily protein [Chromobacterium subtsugae]